MWLFVIVNFCKCGIYFIVIFVFIMQCKCTCYREFVLYIKDNNGNKFYFKPCVILDKLSVFTTFFVK